MDDFGNDLWAAILEMPEDKWYECVVAYTRFLNDAVNGGH